MCPLAPPVQDAEKITTEKSEYTMNYTFKAYDFNNTAAREHWIGRVTDAVTTGYVDGAFVDGNRGGFNSGITSPCSKDKRAAWAAGLEQAPCCPSLPPLRHTVVPKH